MLHDRNWTEKWLYIKFMKLSLNGKYNSKRVIIELKKKFVDSTQIVDTCPHIKGWQEKRNYGRRKLR